ncbi:ATP-binding protein [Kiloniella laminariae]|uniref:ATP-binding protein n=1 Tax=Kiloniella laminariae TaxID=454162 RepID=A0ABT4LG05_9PROT|nr:ATP-binding protein [Kiloniella laminariae]MCZ4279870.1 ATP-binding protein [Kiloniella laminariae]
MAQVFLIVGNTGAGKSTYAAKLAQQEKAHIFAVDVWMKNLFLMDMPDPASYEWALERTQRIEVQQLIETLGLLEKGMSVILDIGFFARSQRQRVANFLRQNDHIPQVHYLDVDKETRWQRVQDRNRGESETYQFEVSREVFEFCETIFEPLGEEERAQAFVLKP